MLQDRETPGVDEGADVDGRSRAAAALAGLALVSALPAQAAPAPAPAPAPLRGSVWHDRVVSEDPADVTPHLVADAVLPHPAVYALEQSGSTLYAGGHFRAVQNAARTTSFARPNLVAFDARTGAVSRTFTPRLDGDV